VRTTSKVTKRQIASLSAKPTKPSWLKLAIRDALNDKPMSLERERRMCAALGIRPRYRTRYWRPCLPASLTPEQRAQVVELAATLAGPVPGMKGGV